ncbi:hypothetical protein Y032_0397g705 [Ancylostoma ceylanicum]|uniref:Uncharacterized protein n=1 Tax=Ancylostoma ceylanicum TaxID=53326 RepID=A0A016RRI8_9BILA|nr:hypothetical protein Y032_0397g705 [Ancylostoma ceylanicum]
MNGWSKVNCEFRYSHTLSLSRRPFSRHCPPSSSSSCSIVKSEEALVVIAPEQLRIPLKVRNGSLQNKTWIRDSNPRASAYESASLLTRPSSCTAVSEGAICQCGRKSST